MASCWAGAILSRLPAVQRFSPSVRTLRLWENRIAKWSSMAVAAELCVLRRQRLRRPQKLWASNPRWRIARDGAAQTVLASMTLMPDRVREKVAAELRGHGGELMSNNTLSTSGLPAAYLRGIASGIGEGLISPRKAAAVLGVTVHELAELFAQHGVGEAISLKGAVAGRRDAGGVKACGAGQCADPVYLRCLSADV